MKRSSQLKSLIVALSLCCTAARADLQSSLAEYTASQRDRSMLTTLRTMAQGVTLRAFTANKNYNVKENFTKAWITIALYETDFDQVETFLAQLDQLTAQCADAGIRVNLQALRNIFANNLKARDGTEALEVWQGELNKTIALWKEFSTQLDKLIDDSIAKLKHREERALSLVRHLIEEDPGLLSAEIKQEIAQLDREIIAKEQKSKDLAAKLVQQQLGSNCYQQLQAEFAERQQLERQEMNEIQAIASGMQKRLQTILKRKEEELQTVFRRTLQKEVDQFRQATRDQAKHQTAVLFKRSEIIPSAMQNNLQQALRTFIAQQIANNASGDRGEYLSLQVEIEFHNYQANPSWGNEYPTVGFSLRLEERRSHQVVIDSFDSLRVTPQGFIKIDAGEKTYPVYNALKSYLAAHIPHLCIKAQHAVQGEERSIDAAVISLEEDAEEAARF
jgi:hypothetical protein